MAAQSEEIFTILFFHCRLQRVQEVITKFKSVVRVQVIFKFGEGGGGEADRQEIIDFN